jgi:hypothetical protein
MVQPTTKTVDSRQEQIEFVIDHFLRIISDWGGDINGLEGTIFKILLADYFLQNIPRVRLMVSQFKIAADNLPEFCDRVLRSSYEMSLEQRELIADLISGRLKLRQKRRGYEQSHSLIFFTVFAIQGLINHYGINATRRGTTDPNNIASACDIVAMAYSDPRLNFNLRHYETIKKYWFRYKSDIYVGSAHGRSLDDFAANFFAFKVKHTSFVTRKAHTPTQFGR